MEKGGGRRIGRERGCEGVNDGEEGRKREGERDS